MKFRWDLLASCGIVVGAAPPAIAQDTLAAEPRADRSSPAMTEEIIVTARRREESIQDVPVAVTAISGEEFERSGVENFEDIQSMAPGFTTTPTRGSPLATTFTIRGSVQSGSDIVTADPSVGIYLDEVYIARPYGVSVDLLDMESVQILKGPQGTLFGRNSTAGAVLLTTRDPELSELGGQASVAVGADLTRGEAIVNVPIGDRLAVRAGYKRSIREDYIDNIANDPNDPAYTQFNDIAPYSPSKATDTKIGGTDSEIWRVKARWAPISTIDLQLSYEEFKAETAGPVREQNWLAGAPNTNYGLTDDTVSLSFDPRSYAETKSWLMNAVWDASIGTFKLIGSKRKYKSLNEIDFDGADYAAPPFTTSSGAISIRRHGSWGRSAGDQKSIELQYNTDKLFDGLNLTVGGLYFDEYAVFFDYSYGLDPFEQIAAGNSVVAGGNWVSQDSSSWGAYGQASYKVMDRLNLTGGLRYTHDKKSADIIGSSAGTRAVNVLPSFDFKDYASQLSGDTTLSKPSDSWSSLDWLLSVDYEVFDDVLVYVKASTGYRAGGFNGRGPSAPGTNLIYDPEELTEYEFGVKADLFHRRLRWNTAIYTNETMGQQFNVLSEPTGDGGTPGTTTLNAGKSSVTGLETELHFIVNDNLSVSGTYAYTDAKIKSLVAYDPLAGEVREVPEDRLPNTERVPDHEFSLSMNYDRDFNNFKISATALYSWTDEMIFTLDSPAEARASAAAAGVNFTLAQLEQWNEYLTSDAFGTLNASVRFSSLDERYNLTLWGRNVLDTRKARGCTGQISGRAYQYASCWASEPAMFGATLLIKFDGY